MIDWLWSLLPWWAWFVAVGALLLAAFLTLRAFGVPISMALSTVVGIAAAVFSGVVYNRGRQAEREKIRRARERAAEEAGEIRDELADTPLTDKKEELRRWRD